MKDSCYETPLATLKPKNTLKSKQDLIMSLMKGDVYNFAGCRVFYDENENNPFRVANSKSNESLNLAWEDYNEFELAPRWYEEITAPVLCWVHDSDTYTTQIDLITEYSKSEGLFHGREPWLRAKPLTQKEVAKYILTTIN